VCGLALPAFHEVRCSGDEPADCILRSGRALPLPGDYPFTRYYSISRSTALALGSAHTYAYPESYYRTGYACH